MMKEIKISELDILHLALLRKNVDNFIESCAAQMDSPTTLILDIAPQVHAGAKAYFKKGIIKTLDIDINSGADIIADLCKNNEKIIADASFDIIICTEVLEHTLQPFDAVDEIERLLKPKGVCIVTTPCNFRIHGPLPDCWRFTEHGLRALFKNFQDITINALETPDRDLFPIHYTLTAVKK